MFIFTRSPPSPKYIDDSSEAGSKVGGRFLSRHIPHQLTPMPRHCHS